MISTNAGPKSFRSKPSDHSTKGFWQPTFPTLPTRQIWFVETSDTFSRRPCRLLVNAFRPELGGMRFGMVCVGNGVRMTVF